MNTAMAAAVAAERAADMHRAAQTHRRAHDATATPAPTRARRRSRLRFGWVTAKRPPSKRRSSAASPDYYALFWTDLRGIRLEARCSGEGWLTWATVGRRQVRTIVTSSGALLAVAVALAVRRLAGLFAPTLLT